MNLPRALRLLRESAGLTQVELSRKLGSLSEKPSLVAGYESGKQDPSLRQCERIAKACGSKVDILFHLALDPSPKPLLLELERLRISLARLSEENHSLRKRLENLKVQST